MSATPVSSDASTVIGVDLPALDDLLERLYVVALPMRVRFRGVTTREVALLHGPTGWGEFGAFPEYADPEASAWLAAALEAAYTPLPEARRTRIPINATVPAVDAAAVPEVLSRFPGASTAKVKVAEPGQSLAEDVARVNAVRAHVPVVRIDANAGWTVPQAVAALTALTADGALEYAEQPCATVEELAELRCQLPEIAIAADESIRRASDPLRVANAHAADIAVLKVAPLGGVRALLNIADRINMPVVISSALDSAVGIGIGLRAAAALPVLAHACGLGTGGFFVEDVIEPLRWRDGYLDVAAAVPDPDRLAALAAPADRLDWWRHRVAACHRLLDR